MVRQEDNDSDVFSLSSRQRRKKIHSDVDFLFSFFFAVASHITDAIGFLSLYTLVRACHSRYVRAVCTFALLRSSPEVVL